MSDKKKLARSFYFDLLIKEGERQGYFRMPSNGSWAHGDPNIDQSLVDGVVILADDLAGKFIAAENKMG